MTNHTPPSGTGEGGGLLWPCVELGAGELEQGIPQRFEKLVTRYPHRPAAMGEHYQFTYGQLNAAANRIAHAVLDRRGPGEEPVAILLDNDALAIAAMLGILKAGKFYVPLDPAVPRERLGYFVSDSTAALIVTSSAHEPLARSVARGDQDLLNVDSLDSGCARTDPKLPILPEALAYIYYTSGSSGKPKGVYTSQRTVLHRVLRNHDFFQFRASDRLSCIRSLSFSGSIKDVYCALLTGASVWLFDVRSRGFVQMARWLEESEITIFVSVATSYRQLAAALGAGPALPAMRAMHIGGEPIRWSDLELHERHFYPTCRLALGLGITETGNVTRLFVDRGMQGEGEDVPAGYLLSGMEVLILDEAGREMAPGQVGQIAVRSEYMSLGYWRQPELTRARFLPDPAGSSARVYLTGDTGYLRSDGCLFCLGRADDQVKVAGHRVELGEIEQVLLTHPQVDEAVVVAYPSSFGDPLLAAYFVPAGRQAPPVGDLRRYLGTRLAAPIIPSRFVPLEQMPLTRSGKVDRLALPAPDRSRPLLASAYVEPRTPLEETVAAVWGQVLGLDQVGIHDNFFELGGHSLLATQIISRLHAAHRVEVSFQTLFDAPTVAGIAAAMERKRFQQAQLKPPGQLDQLERLVAELEQMPDDDVAQILLEEGETE